MYAANGLNGLALSNVMYSTIGELLIKLGTLKEDLRIWENWHCKKVACDEHLCRVRSTKMFTLKVKLDRLRDECEQLLEARRLAVK